MAFTTAFQPNAFQDDAFQGGSIGKVIATTNYSLHPVNCQMEGNAPSIKDGERTVEWASGKAGTKVTASTSGARRLSKNEPTFTVRTKQGVILD